MPRGDIFHALPEIQFVGLLKRYNFKNAQDNILVVYSPPAVLQKYSGCSFDRPPDGLDTGAYSSMFKKVPLLKDFVSSAFRAVLSKPSLEGVWSGRGVCIRGVIGPRDRGLASL